MTRLDELRESIIEAKVAQQQLERLETELKSHEKKLQDLKLKMYKEKNDFDKLSKLSLTSILASLSGSKDERLSKEKREYIHAKAKYDQYILTIEDYKSSIDKKRQIANNISVYESEYEKLLLSQSDITEEQKTALTTIDELKKQNIEIKEALAIGRTVKTQAQKAIKLLDNAKNWNTADMLFDSFLISIAKQEKISKINEVIQQLQSSLNKFKKELKDVNHELRATAIQISNSAYVFDVFFDNLFTDIHIGNILSTSYSQISKLHMNTSKILDELSNKQNDNNRTIQQQYELIYKKTT